MSGLFSNKRPIVGGFFDVHKHVVLTGVLTQLKQQLPKLHFIDAHAGAGLYDLPEVESGDGGVNVEVLFKANKNELTDQYIEIVKSCNNSVPLLKYPGSPLIAKALLGPLDAMSLIELNLEDYSELNGLFETSSQVFVEHGSAFDRVLKRVPVDGVGGAVLIDPDYVIEEDLTDTANLIIQCRNKWDAATILVSIPVTGRSASDRYIVSILKDAGITNMYYSDFEFESQAIDGKALPNNSRMLLVNPQFEIIETLESALSQLSASLPDSMKVKSSIKAI